MYFAQIHPIATGYTPGVERDSLYKDVWRRFWPEFQDVYVSRFQSTYGPLTRRKTQEVERLLACGRFSNGFVRHECTGCGNVLVVPFSCKSRLCLSCYRKKLFSWSLNLSKMLEPSFGHSHITFTMPGRLGNLLLKRHFDASSLAKIAARVYGRFLQADQNFSREWMPGILATVHKCGNSLNPNPHVHMIASRELLNRKTGELKSFAFLNYPVIRKLWMVALCRHLVRKGALTAQESRSLRHRFQRGFNVHFQTLKRGDGDMVFRTAEYLADGFFHNSQITSVDYEKRRITFIHKSRVDRRGKKLFATVAMDVFEFMARMLYYLPDRHEKTVRYYGIYAQSKRRGMQISTGATWSTAIRTCFHKDPELCPDCGAVMAARVVFAFSADVMIRRLQASHALVQGYFRRRPP